MADEAEPDLFRRIETEARKAAEKRWAGKKKSSALHFMYYNFVRLHKTLRVTPAMAAGVTGRLWEMDDIVELAQ